MTHIVEGFTFKKDFAAAVERNPKDIFVKDPSVVGAVSGRLPYVMEIMEARGDVLIVTNHPKRSWYASVESSDGVIKVK